MRLHQMLDLMNQCQDLDIANDPATKGPRGSATAAVQAVLSGIVPGTRWCGAGDRATTYADLGRHRRMDRCCRAHDLCPLRLLAGERRLGLHNEAAYTRSHCRCDDGFYDCLREADTAPAATVETIYFRLVRVPCIEWNDEAEGGADGADGEEDADASGAGEAGAVRPVAAAVWRAARSV